jgi:hypothetical protein
MYISNCCSAKIINYSYCSACGEHCEAVEEETPVCKLGDFTVITGTPIKNKNHNKKWYSNKPEKEEIERENGKEIEIEFFEVGLIDYISNILQLFNCETNLFNDIDEKTDYKKRNVIQKFIKWYKKRSNRTFYLNMFIIYKYFGFTGYNH